MFEGAVSALHMSSEARRKAQGVVRPVSLLFDHFLNRRTVSTLIMNPLGHFVHMSLGREIQGVVHCLSSLTTSSRCKVWADHAVSPTTSPIVAL